MQDWTCEECFDYEKLENIRKIFGFCTMGIQVAVFTWLLIVLTVRKYSGVGQVSCMVILISIFAFLNGAFSLLRVNENSVDIYARGQGYDLYQMTYMLESIFFIGAMWFYSIIYYQTSKDLKLMLNIKIDNESSQDSSNGSSDLEKLLSRKRKLKRWIFNWLMFAIFCLCQAI